MSVSINWATKVISVLQADLAHLGGSNYQFDSDWFRLQLKDLEDDEAGIVYPKTHNHSTQVLLGGISYARIVEVINGYTVTFEETGSPYLVSIVGSNNNILDVTNLGTVQLRSNNSAGLINVTELQHDIFGGAVHYKASSGYSGITYAVGTPLKPVDNFTDAVTIAAVRGFNVIDVIGNATLGAGDDVTAFELTGQNPSRTLITLGAAATTSVCEIVNASVQGVLDGGSTLTRCVLPTSALTLRGSVTVEIVDSRSGVPGQDTPTVDCGGDGPPLSMRGYIGGVKLRNKTGTAKVSIDLSSGQVILANTVIAGEIVVRGVGKLIDEAGDPIYSGAWNGATIINETVNAPVLAKEGSLLTTPKYLGLQ